MTTAAARVLIENFIENPFENLTVLRSEAEEGKRTTSSVTAYRAPTPSNRGKQIFIRGRTLLMPGL